MPLSYLAAIFQLTRLGAVWTEIAVCAIESGHGLARSLLTTVIEEGVINVA
jgi:hypothetical protein